MRTIGKAILYHLEKHGCSKYKMAQRLGVGSNCLQTYTSENANPTFYTLMRIANALGIKVSEIVATAEEMKNEQ